MSIREELKSFAGVSVGAGLLLALLGAMLIHGTPRAPLATIIMLLPVGWVLSVVGFSTLARLIWRASERDYREIREQMAEVRAKVAAMSIDQARDFVEERIRSGAVEIAPWMPDAKRDGATLAPALHGMFENAQSLTVVSTGWSIDATTETPDETPPQWRLIADFELHEQVWVNMRTGKVAVAFDCSFDDVPTDDLLPSAWHVIAERLLEVEDNSAQSGKAGSR